MINLTTDQLASFLSGNAPLIPTYRIIPVAPINGVLGTVTEGSTATFNVTTTNVADGTLLTYRLSGRGIDGGDIVGGMEGSFQVNGGRGVINIPIVADSQVEGPENLDISIVVNGPSPVMAGVIINDAVASGTRTLIESKGTVSLYRNADGTFSANEGSTSTLIKDYGNPPTPTRISDIVAADYLNGHRIVVFSSGHSWYVDSNWQKAPVGPNGQDVINLTTDQLASFLSGSNYVPSVPVIRSIVETTGTVSLYRNSNGTYSASENGTLTTIKDAGQTSPTKISNIVAADYYNGVRIVVFASGHAWYVDSNWQKAKTGPNGAETTELSTAQVATFTGNSALLEKTPSYFISPNTPSIQEGQTAQFSLITNNVTPGTIINYALMGVTQRDVVGGSLAGSVTTETNGTATISIPTVVDPTFGNKILSISLSVSGDVVSRSMLINDQTNETKSLAPIVDKVKIAKPSSEFSLNVSGSSAQLVPLKNPDTPNMLNNIDRLEFTDVKLALDTAPTESAGQTILLLGAVLPGNLALDYSKQTLLGSVINLFDQNFSINALSSAVLRLPIWDILTQKVAPSKADIAAYLIENVYSTPSETILQEGIRAMNNEANEGEFLANLSLSAANQSHIGLSGIQTTGLVYL